MSVYVQITQETGDSPQKVESRSLMAEMCCDVLAPIANYVLLDLVSYVPLAALRKYSRWSEPGLCLFLRLLQSSPQAVWARPTWARCLTVSLVIGPRPASTLEVERVRMELDGSAMTVSWLSTMSLPTQTVCSVPESPNRTLRGVIGRGLASAFGWGAEVAPMPQPLSEVPIRKMPTGREYVLVRDIPVHPRAHFLRRYGIPFDSPAASATDWRTFIGSNALIRHKQ